MSDQGRIPGEALSAAGGSSPGRKARRRKNLIVGSVVGGLVAVGAVVAILASAGGSRSGTLTDYAGTCAATTGGSGASGPTTTAAPTTTSALAKITGAGAAALNKALLGTNLIPTGDFSFAPGFVVNSMVVNSTSAPYSGTAVVTVGGKLQLNMSMSVTDCKNFALNVATSASSTTTVATGLTLDPSTFTGSITEVNGTATWALTGTSKIWTLGAGGATLTTTPTIANSCPTGLTCPSGDDRAAYLWTNGTISWPNWYTLNVTGAVRLDGGWALLTTTPSSPPTLNLGQAGGLQMTNSSFTVWKTSTHQSNPISAHPDLVMPDLSTLNQGLNFEFCGTFQITTPITGDQATGGCVELSGTGSVVALSKNLNTTSATANSSASVNTNVKGFAWTDMPSSYTGVGGIATVSFSGVPTPTFPNTISMGGVSTLPGVVMAALGKSAVPFNFNVSGKFSTTGFTVTGSVPVNLTISNKPPLAIDVKSLDGTIAWSTSGGGSLTIGTQSQLTLGYSPATSTATSSVALQISPQGIALTLTALGTPLAGDTTDGLTPATRLAHPSQAQYLSTKWMGIDGLNLWSLTGSIGWGSDGLPTLTYSTSTYINPNGANTRQFIKCSTSTCGDSDWMVSTVIVGAGVDNTCFAYTFDGTSTSGGATTLSLNGGVIKTSRFALGASASGCTVGGITLPAGFAGLKFSTTIGSTSLDLTLAYSVTNGFCYAQNIGNLVLLGVTYNQVNLSVSMAPTQPTGTTVTCGAKANGDPITSSGGTKTSFYGQWTVPKVGTTTVDADMSANSTGGIQASLNAKLPTFTSNYADFALSDVAFSGSFLADPSGCGYIDTSATGSLAMKSKTYTLNAFALKIDCHGLQKFLFNISFVHGTYSGAQTAFMNFAYNAATSTLQASAAFQTSGSWKFSSYAGKFTAMSYLNYASNWGSTTPSGSFYLSMTTSAQYDGTLNFRFEASANLSLTWGTSGDATFGGGIHVELWASGTDCKATPGLCAIYDFDIHSLHIY